jgi:hypothetical protein
MNLNVFLSYYRKKGRRLIIDKPILFSELKELYENRHQMTDALCIRLNELGAMTAK